MKSYRAWQPEQSFLLPQSPREWLPSNHLAYFILDLVEGLDLSRIDAAIQKKDPRGERPYSPRMMVALILYGYSTGVFSSRRIARATYDVVAFRVLCGGCHPHFTRVSAFRKSHLSALSALFLQVLRLCQKAGLVRLGHVSLDGTKVQANASKHKAMSYERMEKKEEELATEISDLLERAAQIDAKEDSRLGELEDWSDLPEELRRRETRLSKLQDAKAALEREARAVRRRRLIHQAQRNRKTAQQHSDPIERRKADTRAKRRLDQASKLEDAGTSTSEPASETSQGLRTHSVPVTRSGRPKPSAQRNFTDPDSRIMERNSQFLQGYNCQAAVDEAAQIIVAHAVTNQPPDCEHLTPMLHQVRSNTGRFPDAITADSGYWRPENEQCTQELGVNAFINIQTSHRTETDYPDSPRARMSAKLQSVEGRTLYARRKATVEPVFGQIKEARGFRRFLLRGIEPVIGEWGIICTTHNLLKLFRSRCRLAATG